MTGNPLGWLYVAVGAGCGAWFYYRTWVDTGREMPPGALRATVRAVYVVTALFIVFVWPLLGLALLDRWIRRPRTTTTKERP